MRATYLLFFRSLLLETVLLLFLYSPSPRWSGMLATAFGAYLIFSFSFYALERSGRAGESASLASFFADIAWATWVLYLEGGASPDFYLTYFLIILGSAFLERLSFSFVLGGLACAVYASMEFHSLSETMNTGHLLGLSLLLVISFFSAYVADYMRKSRQVLVAQYEKRLAWMERLASLGNALTAILHDLRTPLNAIGLSAEYLEESRAVGNNGKALRSLDAIRKESDRALEVLSEYLEFLKPELGRRSSVDVVSLLSGMLKSMKDRLKELGVSPDFPPSPACRVAAGERQLERAFSNLIENSIESMPKGGRLVVAVRRQEARVLISITDTGAGMTSEQVGRLFEPSGFASDKGRGRGLGFSVARWIIIKHGGEVHIESARGLGTQVRVALPLADANPPLRGGSTA